MREALDKWTEVDPAAQRDVKLILFRFLAQLPLPVLRTYGRRAYFGRRRTYVTVDIDIVMKELPANPVIIDLGANQGSFSRRVVTIAGELHSFEPDPVTFEQLSSELGGRKNVTLYNAAVGARDGEVEFFRGTNFEANPTSASLASSTFSSHEGVRKDGSFRVPQIGILSLLERIGKRVDLIKMDIEGSEVPLLETLLASEAAKNISTILVETHEHCIPDLVDRTFALRQHSASLSQPVINFDWH